MKPLFAFGLLALGLLAGCASSPPPPDWKMNTVSLLEHYQIRWLEGDSTAAQLALDKSRRELSKTGRLDLLARLELAVCGTRAAALDFTPCTAYSAVAGEAEPAERAYVQFLSGDWTPMDSARLPAHYQRLVQAKDMTQADQALTEMAQPLPRLIGAGILFKQGRATPATLAAAVETASSQGWRRPLLTWLAVQQKRAETAGDTAEVARIQRRIGFVEGR